MLGCVWRADLARCVDSAPLYLHCGSGRDLVVAASHAGLVRCLALHTGQPVWTARQPDRVEAAPVCCPGGARLLLGCHDHSLHCLAVATGRTLWTFPAGGLVKCSPLVR